MQVVGLNDPRTNRSRGWEISKKHGEEKPRSCLLA